MPAPDLRLSTPGEAYPVDQDELVEGPGLSGAERPASHVPRPAIRLPLIARRASAAKEHCRQEPGARYSPCAALRAVRTNEAVL